VTIVWCALLGGVLGAYVTFMGWITLDTHKGYAELRERERTHHG
jgi:hypothetical protein